MNKNTFFLNLFLSLTVLSQSVEELEEIAKKNSILFEDLNNEEINEAFNITGEDTSLDNLTESKNSDENEEVSDIFGLNFFDKTPTSISSTSDLPVPDNYIVSFGDKIKVILTGGRKDILELEVDMSGSINFPEIGSINVFGESISDVRQKIEQIISLSYVGTNVSVSLGELSARKINILGAVKSPGTYIVNPFSTLSSALAYSGGFEDYASLREIVLIRGGKRNIYDLYDLLVFGNRESDVNIEQGDTILINSTKNLVEISGSVNRPMKYQFKPDDTYSDLLDFAMGITRDASLEELNVKKVKNGILIQEKISINDKLNSVNIFELSVPKKIFTKNLNVEVVGEGVSQKTFLTENFKKLSMVIANLDFSDDIYPFIGVLTQDAENRIFKEKHFFSLEDPSTYENIELKLNPVIKFFSRDQIIENQTFTEINFPNKLKKIFTYGSIELKLPIIGKISINTLVDYFGLASTVNLEESVVTFDDGNSSKEPFSNYEANIVTGFFVSEPFTQYVEVEAKGLFSVPGTYRLPVGSTLKDLYKITGGLLDRNISISMTRESLKQAEKNALEEAKKQLIDLVLKNTGNIALSGSSSVAGNYEGILPLISLAESTEPVGRLSGNLNPDSEFLDTLILEEGDIISANPQSNLVSIVGQVLNPVTIQYQPNLSVPKYIMLAGNYTEMADKKNIFIVKTDGTSIPYDDRLFQKEFILHPGDTIVVPRDFDRVSTLPLVNSAAQIISNIAFAAASLNTLNN